MKPIYFFLVSLFAAALLTGCGVIEINSNVKTVTPSDNIISETRTVSGFTGVDLRTIGDVTITQGDSESLVVKGSDNLLPLVKTTVQSGVLVIEMDANITVTSLNRDDILSFTIQVKDLSKVTVSGLGKVQMNKLATQNLDLTMSGAGGINLGQVDVDQLSINVTGLGGITVAGKANHADIKISGAGSVDAGSLECQTAKATIPGLGSTTIWVTGELTGNISGAGSVRYYGDPKENTETTGLGQFVALGSK